MAKNNKIKEEKPQKIDTKNKGKEPIHDVIGSFYANGIMVNFNEDEFVFEFYQNPIQDDGSVDTFRVYILPDMYKKLRVLCEKTLKTYEKEFGEIKISGKSIERVK